MEINSAIRALSALGQESRLTVFRLLVRAGPDGMPAGAIARATGVPHNTMSAQLAVLANAGLVRARRDGRSILYAVDFETVRGLLGFLMEDCCRGARFATKPMLDRLFADREPLDNGRNPDETFAR